MVFHMGSVKHLLTNGCTPFDTRLYTSYRFSDVKDIPIAVEKFKVKVPENYRSQINYSIYADKSTQISEIAPVVHALEELHDVDVYLCLNTKSSPNAFEPRVIKCKYTELSSGSYQEFTLQDYINNMVDNSTSN